MKNFETLLASLITTLVACAQPVAAPSDDEPEEPSCATASCGANASCSEASGVPVCSCDPGFNGNGETCVDVNECVAGNLCAAGNVCVNEAGGFECLPTSCAAVLAASPGALDGTYTLYVGGDPAKSWDAFCAGMADTAGPREYVPLVNVGGEHNFSQYTAGGASIGTSARTSYRRLRIDPATLVVDIADQTFSTSTGSVQHGNSGIAVTSMPFGVAMNCAGPDAGLANIDLRGTPFAVIDKFVGGGNPDASQTETVFEDNKQVVELRGGGGCGWNASSGAAFNPFNFAPGTLKLGYAE